MPAITSVETALSLIESDKSKILTLIVGEHTVKPGQHIPKAETKKAPELAFNHPTGTPGTYMVISLDIDAPLPSFNVLGPILHWIQPGLKPQVVSDGVAELVYPDTPFVANYIGPSPPPGSAPHRYVFLLYEQPASFDSSKYAPAGGKKLSNWYRMRYDLGAFEKEEKLGPVIAANYFVSN